MAARDETVLAILGVITAFGALRFIVRPFNGQAPLRERGVVIRFKKLSRVYGSLNICWFNRTQKGLGYCRVDLQAADVKAVDAAAVLDPFVQAMVIGRLVGSTIVSFKFAAAVATGGQTMQQGGAFSRRRRLRTVEA
jgi:hypothetical protein